MPVKQCATPRVTPVLAQDGDEILMRIALMQEHGLAGGGGDLELPAEGATLQVARGEVAEIVEPAFAHRDHVVRRAPVPSSAGRASAVRSAA